MGILRTYALVFIVGWAVWLWMDKTGPAYPTPSPTPGYAAPGMPPGYPAYPPPGGARPAAPPGDDLVARLQYSVDLIKAGQYRQAYVYLWRRESWVLAGLITAILALPGPGLSLARRRRHPPRRPGPER